MRADGTGYDQLILRGLIDPIPQLYDRVMMEARIAAKLGVPVHTLHELEPYYIAAARVMLQIDAKRAAQQREELESMRRKMRKTPIRKRR